MQERLCQARGFREDALNCGEAPACGDLLQSFLPFPPSPFPFNSIHLGRREQTAAATLGARDTKAFECGLACGRFFVLLRYKALERVGRVVYPTFGPSCSGLDEDLPYSSLGGKPACRVLFNWSLIQHALRRLLDRQARAHLVAYCSCLNMNETVTTVKTVTYRSSAAYGCSGRKFARVPRVDLSS